MKCIIPLAALVCICNAYAINKPEAVSYQNTKPRKVYPTLLDPAWRPNGYKRIVHPLDSIIDDIDVPTLDFVNQDHVLFEKPVVRPIAHRPLGPITVVERPLIAKPVETPVVAQPAPQQAVVEPVAPEPVAATLAPQPVVATVAAEPTAEPAVAAVAAPQPAVAAVAAQPMTEITPAPATEAPVTVEATEPGKEVVIKTIKIEPLPEQPAATAAPIIAEPTVAATEQPVAIAAEPTTVAVVPEQAATTVPEQPATAAYEQPAVAVSQQQTMVTPAEHSAEGVEQPADASVGAAADFRYKHRRMRLRRI